MAVVALIFALSAAFAIVAMAETCTSEDIRNCNNLLGSNNIPNLNLPFFQGQTLDGFCSGISSYDRCITTILSSCSDSDKLSLRGSRTMFRYLCTNSGRKALARNRPCYRQSQAQLDMDACHVTFFDTVYMNDADRCRGLADLMYVCMPQVISSHCQNDQSRIFLQKITTLRFRPWMNALQGDCDPEEVAEEVARTTPGVTTAVVTPRAVTTRITTRTTSEPSTRAPVRELPTTTVGDKIRNHDTTHFNSGKVYDDVTSFGAIDSKGEMGVTDMVDKEMEHTDVINVTEMEKGSGNYSIIDNAQASSSDNAEGGVSSHGLSYSSGLIALAVMLMAPR